MQQRIIQGFIEEIQDKSMKFTMDDLARRLGISKRTLYEHFSSKVEILDTLIEQTLTEFDVKTEQIIQNEQLTLLEKIEATIKVIPQYNEFYDLKILEQMKRYFPAQWERINTALHQWDALEGLIRQGVEEGIILHQNVPLIMKLIINATNLTLERRFFLDNSTTISEAYDSIVDIILFGLVGKQQQN